MVNPVSDTSESLISIFDSQKQKNSSQGNKEYLSTNVALSEQARGFKIFEGDSPAVGVLKNEFDEVFGFGDDKKELFLKKLDRILVDNGL